MRLSAPGLAHHTQDGISSGYSSSVFEDIYLLDVKSMRIGTPLCYLY